MGKCIQNIYKLLIDNYRTQDKRKILFLRCSEDSMQDCSLGYFDRMRVQNKSNDLNAIQKFIIIARKVLIISKHFRGLDL